MVKVRNKTTGRVHEVSRGHFSVTHADYEVLEGAPESKQAEPVNDGESITIGDDVYTYEETDSSWVIILKNGETVGKVNGKGNFAAKVDELNEEAIAEREAEAAAE